VKIRPKVRVNRRDDLSVLFVPLKTFDAIPLLRPLASVPAARREVQTLLPLRDANRTHMIDT
jgi:hypothetical protein